MNSTLFCKHLRTKSMYIPALVGEDKSPLADEAFGHARHYWCNCTACETGPDDKQVGPGACKADRSCFEE